MSDIKVYGIPGSPFLRSVEIGLREKGVGYRFHPLAPGEHKQPDHSRATRSGASLLSNMTDSASTRRRRSSATSTTSSPIHR